ncbi:MAG: hypothetical protein J7K36_00680 [Archaeoglobaceae archaeon]|nr:hypothetical protein [Archaeoglobaceae archaeon]
MCLKHDKALKACWKFVRENEEFTLNEFLEYVVKEAETTRIAPGRDARDWLSSLIRFGEIEEVSPFSYKRTF